MPSCSVRTLPFSTPRDVMLAMLICATRWLSMHLYMLAYMSMHESCLLVCRPYFNTIKLWTSDPNLHLSPVDTTLLFACLLVCLFACLLAILLVCLIACLLASFFYVCHIYHIYLLHASIMCSLHLFLPLLVCWFLVFAFACTHMKRGHMELGHSPLGVSKKGVDASKWI